MSGRLRGVGSRRQRLLLLFLVLAFLCALVHAAPRVVEEEEEFYGDNEVQLDVEVEADPQDPSEPVIEVEEEVELDENGEVVVKEPVYDEDGNLVEGDPEEWVDPELALHHPDYIVDEVQTDEDVRVRLVLDEVSEYFDEEGVTWYKLQLHMQNIGEIDICAVTIEVSNKSHVEEVWTLNPVPETDNLYELLWVYNVSFAQTRYFGLITQGKEVPNVHIYSALSCNATEGASGLEEAVLEEEDDPNVPTDALLEDASRRKRKLQTKTGPPGGGAAGAGKIGEEVMLEVDALAEKVVVAFDEVREVGKGPGKRHVLVNAHMTNTATVALCDLSLWVYRFVHVNEYWGLEAQTDAAGSVKSDVVRLPTARSALEPGQSHSFGFAMQLDVDYPNMAVLSAAPCDGALASPQV